MERFRKIKGELLREDHALIGRLLGLPHRVLKHHHLDGLAQVVLHDLAHKNSFNLSKATYFVDNPDFDHVAGVAGFHRDESPDVDDVWEDPETFVKTMEKSDYHTNVKKVLKNSLKKRDVDLSDHDEVHQLGRDLGMKNPQALSWEMKHGNHGVLVFETDDDKEMSSWQTGLLHSFVALLGMCAI
ncbi:hypothetical protein HOD08_05355 [bacterium]|nr:hypothetical protein [bacterium]